MAGKINVEEQTPAATTADVPIYHPARTPADEQARLQRLHHYRILDTDAEQCFDDLTRLASLICGTPVALLTFIDEQRQWFKSKVGVEMQSMPRHVSFCAHAILEPDKVLQIPDMLKDARFAGNPVVQHGPKVRYYCGAPLTTNDGSAIGTICVVDDKPRQLTPEQLEALRCLARQAVAQLELREALTRLEQQNLTDALTGVWNRRAFNLRLREEWSRHCRTGRHLSLLMIDVDHFKRFNDSFGHQEGDRVLKSTALLLGKTLRGSDYLVRYGGEEFAVILPESDLKGALVTAERLRLLVSQAEGETVAPVTVSIGVSSALAMRELDRNLLVERADRALYRAKEKGRDRVEVSQSSPAV